MNSITKRWVRGSLLFTLLVLLVAEGVFLYFLITGYYNSVQYAINAQFNTIQGQLSLSSSATAQEKALRLFRTVEQFEDKATYEFMLIRSDGSVVTTSSGVLPSSDMVAPDVEEVLADMDSDGARYLGANENGENVMAVTLPTPYSTEDIVAMRLVTSMTNVNRTIRTFVIYSLVFLFALLLASIISGLYFIRSIVIPLQKVESTASRIAHGDFAIRIENQRDDEIGSLCKTINNMAEELSKSEKMKNDFISSVSHELRTPLTSIKGWTETVGSLQGPSDPNFRRGVQVISNETDRLYDMVEELLDFSRMQQGLTLAPELLDLAAELEDAILLAQSRAEHEGIRLEYTAPDLPVPVMADKNRVRQVMINIVDNALKYSFKGGEIKAEILQDASNAFVYVSDEGRGISKEDLQHVKSRFYKGKGAIRGSGIGLAVVDEIMQAHEGGLEITSEENRGTQVVLRFPLYKKKRKRKSGDVPKSLQE